MSKRRIILYDGYCMLCDSSIQFIIKRDPNKRFKLAPLQSKAGQQLLKAYDIPVPSTSKKSSPLSSVIYIEGDRYYQKSTAALRILKALGGGWQLLYAFIIIPPFLRHFVYDIIARYRYRWFGHFEECQLPDAEQQKHFLEGADQFEK